MSDPEAGVVRIDYSSLAKFLEDTMGRRISITALRKWSIGSVDLKMYSGTVIEIDRKRQFIRFRESGARNSFVMPFDVITRAAESQDRDIDFISPARGQGKLTTFSGPPLGIEEEFA
jgi:hypothetical protein